MSKSNRVDLRYEGRFGDHRWSSSSSSSPSSPSTNHKVITSNILQIVLLQRWTRLIDNCNCQLKQIYHLIEFKSIKLIKSNLIPFKFNIITNVITIVNQQLLLIMLLLLMLLNIFLIKNVNCNYVSIQNHQNSTIIQPSLPSILSSKSRSSMSNQNQSAKYLPFHQYYHHHYHSPVDHIHQGEIIDDDQRSASNHFKEFATNHHHPHHDPHHVHHQHQHQDHHHQHHNDQQQHHHQHDYHQSDHINDKQHHHGQQYQGDQQHQGDPRDQGHGHELYQTMNNSTESRKYPKQIVHIEQSIPMELSQTKCISKCNCKWRSGKIWVECIEQSLREIPTELDPMTQVLYLSGNPLSQLSERIFDKLELRNIQRLYLDNCKLSSIDSNTFQSLSNLIELNLAHNELQRLPTSADSLFQHCPILRKLSLSFNQLKLIQNDTFVNLKYLQSIDLSSNQIIIIELNSFDQLINLKQLYLHDNRLRYIDGNIMKSLPSLYELTLHQNQWTCDCKLRKLREWMIEKRISLLSTISSYIPNCTLPKRLQGRSWNQLDLDEFACRPKLLSVDSDIIVYEGENASIGCVMEAIPNVQIEWEWRGKPIRNMSLMTFGRQMYLIRETLYNGPSLTSATSSTTATNDNTGHSDSPTKPFDHSLHESLLTAMSSDDDHGHHDYQTMYRQGLITDHIGGGQRSFGEESSYEEVVDLRRRPSMDHHGGLSHQTTNGDKPLKLSDSMTSSSSADNIDGHIGGDGTMTNKRTSTLYIMNALEKDSGNYVCTGYNKAGSVEANITLTVLRRLQVTAAAYSRQEMAGIVIGTILIVALLIVTIFSLVIRSKKWFAFTTDNRNDGNDNRYYRNIFNRNHRNNTNMNSINSNQNSVNGAIHIATNNNTNNVGGGHNNNELNHHNHSNNINNNTQLLLFNNNNGNLIECQDYTAITSARTTAPTSTIAPATASAVLTSNAGHLFDQGHHGHGQHGFDVHGYNYTNVDGDHDDGGYKQPNGRLIVSLSSNNTNISDSLNPNLTAPILTSTSLIGLTNDKLKPTILNTIEENSIGETVLDNQSMSVLYDHHQPQQLRQQFVMITTDSNDSSLQPTRNSIQNDQIEMYDYHPMRPQSQPMPISMSIDLPLNYSATNDTTRFCDSRYSNLPPQPQLKRPNMATSRSTLINNSVTHATIRLNPMDNSSMTKTLPRQPQAGYGSNYVQPMSNQHILKSMELIEELQKRFAANNCGANDPPPANSAIDQSSSTSSVPSSSNSTSASNGHQQMIRLANQSIGHNPLISNNKQQQNRLSNNKITENGIHLHQFSFAPRDSPDEGLGEETE